ncbi:hypothetical protein ACFLXC_06260 [Chloroflexota bacterium]
MVKKKENIGNRLEKAKQENRTLVLEYLNLKYHGASPEYKKGFKEGVEFFKEFPNAALEIIRYLETIERDQ